MLYHLLRHSLIVSALLFFSVNAQATTQIEKFVYVFDSQGQLITPDNAATQCPDPVTQKIANRCSGVAVDENGNYELVLPGANIADDSALLLQLNTYNVNHGAATPVYVLLQSRRRGDRVQRQLENKGWDINALSEGLVSALEQSASEQGLAVLLQQNDVKALNRCLLNDGDDNDAGDPQQALEKDRNALRKQKFAKNAAAMKDIIDLAITHQGNSSDLAQIRNAMQQILPQPQAAGEIVQRVFNHVAGMSGIDGSKPYLFLEADKYVVFGDEVVHLSTANSLNPQLFFAYSWDGVDSIAPSAEFSRSSAGSYLVCASGEADLAANSSSDCVRLAVRNQVQAIARASHLRIGGGNSLKLSAALSLGATQYAWSGAGSFSAINGESSDWTAPLASGVYTISLSINNGEDSDSVEIEVFGVEPVAVAEARPDVVYLQNGSASVSLVSGSIANDGSAVDSLSWEVVSAPVGANFGIGDSAASETSFVTDSWGDYVVQLSATKSNIVKSVEVAIQVRRVDAPVADAGVDVTTYRNQPVTLDGGGSYTVAGDSLSYVWSANNGTLANANQAKAEFSADQLGSYPVQLQVSAANGNASDTVTVNVVNQAPVAAADVVANLLNEVLYGQAVAYDLDRDKISYELLSQPVNGGVTMNPDNGAYVYVPGGVKGCQYKPYQKPSSNFKGGMDVPVIKLCADKYIAAIGEPINLTTSNSINASKFSGYTWDAGIVADANDITHATYTATQAGYKELCIVGNIGQSNNTSTACVTVLIGAGSIDDNAETGYIETFDYRVSDGSDVSPPATIKITIGWQNSPPLAQDIAVQTDEEVAINGQLSASDADGHALSYRLLGNASLGTLTLTDASTGAFSYTPALNAFGVDSVSYVANDGLEDSAPATLSITINNINDVPVAYFTGSVNLDEDTNAMATLGGKDDDGDVLEYRLAFIPGHGVISSFNAASGEVVYTPDADYNGSDSFAFVVHDGQAESNWAWVNVNVAPVNDKPVAQDLGPIYVDQGASVTFSVKGSDVDHDVLTYRNSDIPAKGSLQLVNEATGEFKYTASASDSGVDSFHFVAEDGIVSSDPAVVNLEILPVGVVTASAANIEVFQDVAYGGVLQGSDSGNAALSYKVEQQALKGSVELVDANSGAYIYHPFSGMTGEDHFSFSASNGKRTSANATVNIDIIPASVSCQGPDRARSDADQDGYSTLTEFLLGSSDADAASVPSQSLAQANISFSDDDDGDKFSDISEYWLGHAFNNASDIPTLSTLRGLPDCLSPLYDNQAPLLQAFYIESPLDISNGNGQLPAQFRIAVLDNASGVYRIKFRLRSAHDQLVNVDYRNNSYPVLLNESISSDPFNKYAEQGIWTVEDMQISDARGNSAVYTTSDLVDGGFPVQLQVINSNSDITPPSLGALNVVFDTLDLANAPIAQQFLMDVSDDLSGIEHIELLLLSSDYSKQSLNASWDVSGGPLSLSQQLIESQAFQPYHVPGAWIIQDVTIRDRAQNVIHISHADLVADSNSEDGFSVISTPPPPLLSLNEFHINTPVVYQDIGQSASFTANFTTSLGLASAEVNAVCDNGSEGHSGGYYNLTWPLNLTMKFAQQTSQTQCQVSRVLLVDKGGNQLEYNTQQLVSAGFDYQFTLIPQYPNCDLLLSTDYNPSLGQESTNEDTPYTGKLWGKPNSACSYEIVNQPRLGKISLNVDSGAYTYTPDKNVNSALNGNDAFTFRLNNGVHQSSTQAVHIQIAPVDDVPLVKDLQFTLLQDTLLQKTALGSDPDGEALSFSVQTPPQHGQLISFNSISGVFVYQPDPAYLGSDSFTYTLGNSASTSQPATVTIDVRTDLMDFKVVTKEVSAYEQYVWVKVNFTLLRDVSILEAAQVTMQGPNGESYLLSTFPNGSAYPVQIANNLNTTVTPLTPGIWHFVNLKIKLKNSSAFQLVMGDLGLSFDNTMTAIANTPPATVSPSTITSGITTPINGNLQCSDAEGDALTYHVDSNPSNGDFVLDSQTGAYSFTPTSVANSTVKWHCNDGRNDSAVKVSTVEVLSAQAPICKSQSFIVRPETALVETLYGYQAAGESLSYHIVTAPSKALASLDAQSGKLTYRPQQTSVSGDSLTYKVVADNLQMESANCTISFFDGNPVLASDISIMVVKNQSYSGQLQASGGDGSALRFHAVTNPVLGGVVVNADGTYSYTPNADVSGNDSFSFTAYDHSGNESRSAKVTISIIDDPCLFAGGLDSDGDGYLDYVERLLGSDDADSQSIPSDLSAVDFNQLALLDQDGDGVVDYHELWLGSQANDPASMPSLYYGACFSGASDGIRPQLASVVVATPIVDINQGQDKVSLLLGMLDNASGLRRVRVNLRSPSGSYQSVSVGFDTAPVLVNQSVEIGPFSQYSEAGDWVISGVTLYDYAGNRLDLDEQAVSAMTDNRITVINDLGDATPPSLLGFAFDPAIDIVYPGTASGYFSVQVHASDAAAGVRSARVDLMSPSGIVVSASKTLNAASADVTLAITSDTLSQYAEDGMWTVISLIVVDNAGNSAQFAPDLATAGYPYSIKVTNPQSDTTAPWMESISLLSNNVYPLNGDAKIAYTLSLADDMSGVDRVEIQLQGPSGQLLLMNGVFNPNISLAQTIESPLLNSLTEAGVWTVLSVEVWDDAGNSRVYLSDELAGYNLSVNVMY